MAIKLEKIGVSAGVGVADILLEYVDERQLWTKPFQNATDWGRVAYTAGGYLLNYTGNWEEPAEVAVLAGIPLLEKSLYDFARSLTTPAARGRGRMGLKLKEQGSKQPPQQRSAQIRYV